MRCYCGKSESYPRCDGKHTELGWSCGNTDDVDPILLFSASPKSYNLAQRVADHLQGTSILNARELFFCKTFVYFCDGSDYDHWAHLSSKINADRKILINLGANLPHPNDADWQVYYIAENEIYPIVEIEQILQGQSQAIKHLNSKKVFVTHAVEDEVRLEPIIQKLRQFLAWDLFVCNDSIKSGPWFEQIRDKLQVCDIQLFIISEASNRSVFCAFEAGLGMAWAKSTTMVSLDGSKPPSYLQHLQMWDAVRIGKQKPWLNAQEILMNCILNALGSDT